MTIARSSSTRSGCGPGGVFAGDPESRKTNLGTLILFGLLGLTACSSSSSSWHRSLSRGGGARSGRGCARPALLGFAGLGTGYILVEVALVQKCILFLGSPAYALSVVLLSLLAFGALGARSTAGVPTRRSAGGVRRAVLVTALAAVVAVLVVSPTFASLVALEPAAARRGHDRARSRPWASCSAVPCPSRCGAWRGPGRTSCPGRGA